MYNGVGLATARGTATSGHVQRNLSQARFAAGRRRETDRELASREAALPQRPVNAEVAAHNARRAIEVAVAELRARMEDAGRPEPVIEAAVRMAATLR